MSNTIGTFKPRSFLLGLMIVLTCFIIAAIFLSFMDLSSSTSYGYNNSSSESGYSYLAWFSIPFLIIGMLSLFGFCTLKPKESIVVTEFGEPRGYFAKTGITWNAFWLDFKPVNMADSKIESDTIKINDGNGTPVMTAVAFTARIVDPEKFTYNLEQDFKDFIITGIQGVLRNVIKKHPYDVCETAQPDTITLTKNGEEICSDIERKFNEQVAKYGIKIDDLGFSELAYAPEISASMLQKQQAQANVDAKSTLTKGLCDVVKTVVENMNADNEMSKEQKQKLAISLMIVMVGNQEATPVINVDS